MWQELGIVDTPQETPSFLDAIEVWIHKPHVLNRRLCGAKILWQGSHGDEDTRSTNDECDKTHKSAFTDIQRIILSHDYMPTPTDEHRLKIVVREMIPKNTQKYSILTEFIVIDFDGLCVYFIPVELKPPDGKTEVVKDLGYKIKRHNRDSRISLHILGSSDSYMPSLGYTLTWLKETLLPKLYHWSTEKQLNTDITSLRLVAMDKYNELYQHLKQKYGVPLVEIWPERTDPQKFVYEDVAIATYLLLLWEDDRERKGLTQKQSFVDLGCGNGLLVYILQSEGHPGLGIDLRRRKIWDMYETKLDLKEEAITPSDDNLYPKYDWLIGNHSDELTPWIPVMAARSSYTCSYFVLPCCPWDFSTRFSHKSGGGSQYRSYLDFVQEVGRECGFIVEEDTLRIPSTKRVCFIGRTRVYPAGEEADFDNRRRVYIDGRCQNNPSSSSNKSFVRTQESSSQDSHSQDNQEDMPSEHNQANQSEGCDTLKRKWTNDFQARDSVERPRNCITVAQHLKDKITHRVFWALLGRDVPMTRDKTRQEGVPVMENNDEQSTKEQVWDKGGSFPLSEVAGMFDQADLSQLKSECGGLQTLLRNSHHVFRVQGGHVTLRNWRTDDYDAHQQQKRRRKGHSERGSRSSTSGAQHKTKLCFFFTHHPQGCPLDGNKCRFAHGETELRCKDSCDDAHEIQLKSISDKAAR